MTGERQASSVDEVLALYERWGAESYDEDLNQLDHALQTAALAIEHDANATLVVAALLHDVGHLLDLAAATGPRGGRDASSDLRHEAAGARYLGGLFPPAVTGPVALHVLAKRYLCGTDGSYLERLSDGSRYSLDLQGGPMDAAEISAFRRRPGAEAAISLRRWDDQGKKDDVDVPALDTYRLRLDIVAR